MEIGQQSQPPQIAIAQTSKLKCECGHDRFENTFALRKVSALISGNGKEGVIPIPLFTCKKCGTIHPSTVPPELKNIEL